MGSNGDDNLNMCTYPPRESVGLSDKSPIYAVAPGDVVSRMMVETHCMSIPTNMPTYLQPTVSVAPTQKYYAHR